METEIILDDRDRERFNRYILEGDSCWEWVGVILQSGYGQFSVKGDRYRTHRVAYVIYKGSIPDGFIVHHTCKNKSCVNPKHLECIDRSIHSGNHNTENIKYHNNGSKTECKRGHPLKGINLRTFTSTKGKIMRICRACKKIRDGENNFYIKKGGE
jgi:hypothetical protein